MSGYAVNMATKITNGARYNSPSIFPRVVEYISAFHLRPSGR